MGWISPWYGTSDWKLASGDEIDKVWNIATPTLGSWLRQRLVKVQPKKEARESRFMFPGVQESVREWTLTLPSELPVWELEFRWTPKSSENDCRGQNPLDWKVPCIIAKILELRYLKWVHMTHLDTWHISYGQKKGRESNCQFDSQPLKVGNYPDFLALRWRATYRWEALDESYNFALDIISIGGLHAKLWAPKVAEVPVMGISRLPFRSPGTKWHLGASPVARHII
jgi:hypothetical protein